MKKLSDYKVNEGRVNEAKRFNDEETSAIEKSLSNLDKFFKKEGITTKFSMNDREQIESTDLVDSSCAIVQGFAKTLNIACQFYGKENNTIFFKPKLYYKHVSGGSNGCDFLYDYLILDLDKGTWTPNEKY